MSLVSIVVPVFHNGSSLHELLARFQNLAAKAPEDFEFIFVDDGSKDDSFAVMRQLTLADARVKAVKLVRNFGADAASTAGFSIAKGDVVAAISADLQDPPELILEMLSHWRAGRKIVLAARAKRDDPWLVRTTAAIFWWLFRKLAVPSMPPGGCDYVLVDRVVIEQLAAMHEPTGGVARILWTGYEPAVVHYARARRQARHGRSMWTLSKRITYLVDLFVNFTDFPVRAASILGFLFAGSGAVYAFLLILERLTQPDANAPRGWAISMVVFLLVSGVQLVMIGVLGEYLLRAIATIRRRPIFLIEQVIESPTAGHAAQPSRGPATTDGASQGSPRGVSDA